MGYKNNIRDEIDEHGADFQVKEYFVFMLETANFQNTEEDALFVTEHYLIILSHNSMAHSLYPIHGNPGLFMFLPN